MFSSELILFLSFHIGKIEYRIFRKGKTFVSVISRGEYFLYR